MGKHPDLDTLDQLFEKGCDFQITGKEYEAMTGVPLPQGKSYIKNSSALARKAAGKGYTIVDVQEKPVIVKTVYFKKN